MKKNRAFAVISLVCFGIAAAYFLYLLQDAIKYCFVSIERAEDGSYYSGYAFSAERLLQALPDILAAVLTLAVAVVAVVATVRRTTAWRIAFAAGCVFLAVAAACRSNYVRLVEYMFVKYALLGLDSGAPDPAFTLMNVTWWVRVALFACAGALCLPLIFSRPDGAAGEES